MVLAQVDLTLGAAIMTNLSAMPAKFASLLNLATLRKCPDELLQELIKFVSRANEVSGHRNRVVHGVLIISYETKTILRREPKFRKGSQPRPQSGRYPLIVLNDGAALTPFLSPAPRRLKSGRRPLADRHHRAFGQRLHEFRPLLERGAALCEPVVEVVGFRHRWPMTSSADSSSRLSAKALSVRTKRASSIAAARSAAADKRPPRGNGSEPMIRRHVGGQAKRPSPSKSVHRKSQQRCRRRLRRPSATYLLII
jgi:hypothetical protein